MTLRLLYFTLVSIMTIGSAKKILVMLPAIGPSNMNIFDPIINGLADNGHEIVMLSRLSLRDSHENITQLIFDSNTKKYFSDPFIFLRKKIMWFKMIQHPDHVLYRMCDEFLNLEEVKNVMNNTYGHFDLVITSGLGTECAFGYVHRLKIPFVAILPGIWPFNDLYIGNYLQYSYVPNLFLDYTDKMSFTQRFINIIYTMMYLSYREWVYIPKMNKLLRYHYGNDIPHVKDILKNVSLLLANWDPATGYPRPFLPAMVPIGGVHCNPPNKLPRELETFVEGSGSYGFIYVALGTLIQEGPGLEQLEDKLLDALSKLPQRIIWKKQHPAHKKIPENIKIVHWAPQQDLLGHPKIKAFLSHGGIFSTQESVYHGVPTVMAPFWIDQHANAARLVDRGVAVRLDVLNVTPEEIVDAFNRVINITSYRNKARILSSVMKERPISPKELGIYWIEYVMRNNGTEHLRAASLDLTWYQAYMLDVMLCICAVIILFSYFVYLLVTKVFFHLRNPTFVLKLMKRIMYSTSHDKTD